MNMTSKDNIIKGINQAMSAEIDSIIYDKPPSDKNSKVLQKKPNLLTVDWENVLPEPPKNSSDITRRELELISDMTKELSQEEHDLVMAVDDDPNNVFMPLLKRIGKQFPKDKFDEFFFSQVDPVITNLKYKFKRARPFQLADKYGIDIKVTETETHHTPAYPSGHTAYAAFGGSMLATLYPQHTSEFYELINLAGRARILQGVHYPSDNDASMVIASVLYEDLKYKIFPDMKIRG